MSRLDQRAQPGLWGEKLIIALFRLIQTARLYQDNNQIIKSCLSQFMESMEHLFTNGELKIVISQGRLYIQGEKLFFRKGLVQVIQGLTDFMKQRGLQGFVFYAEFRNASLKEILSFVRILIKSGENDASSAWISQKLDSDGVSWVEVLEDANSRAKARTHTETGGLKGKARDTYLQAKASVKEVAQKLSAQNAAGVRRAKRLVQSMVELVQEDEALSLGLSTIQDYDDYTYTHSVNVAILSMCLGNRIGLSPTSLTYLGICGLFHDLGKVEVSSEILKKPGTLTDDEWEEMRKHPLSSVRQILRLRASHALKSKIILAPYEHHLNSDLSGYPRTYFKKEVSLFGRILHIADFYDAVTSPRIYRPFSYSPDFAIHAMFEGAGKQFDRILLKVFATMMGVYPVGTLLHLDTGEMALVVDYPRERENALPRVVLLHDDGLGGLKRGDMVDLEERDPENGEFRRNVLKSAHPLTQGIQPVHFIM